MRNEEDCKSEERYLFSDELFTDEAIEIIKQRVDKRTKPKHKGKLFNEFINWKRTPNEIALFTYYSYADLKIPKKFDCLFNTNNPSEYIQTNFTLTKCLYEGLFATNALDDGHKHICIFEFENKIPEIVTKLHLTKGESFTYPENKFMIGICNFSDFNAIQQRITHQLKLRHKYGNEWWKYDHE